MNEKRFDEEKIILVTNIQRFSLHDGPGIRTTVFLKGCSLRCPWCSNPENLSHNVEEYIKDGMKGRYGKWYSVKELYDEVMKDVVFYEIEGGVTFSGGETLLQARQLKPLWSLLKDEKNLMGQEVHMAVETCLFVPEEYLLMAIRYIDLFYVDIKILDKGKCREILHGDLSLYEKNIKTLMDSYKPVVLRIPVISGYTDKIDNRSLVADMVKDCINMGNILKIELIKEHNLGRTNMKHSETQEILL